MTMDLAMPKIWFLELVIMEGTMEENDSDGMSCLIDELCVERIPATS